MNPLLKEEQGRLKRVVQAIVDKLQANADAVIKAHSGSLSWRRKPNGEVEVDLEPRL